MARSGRAKPLLVTGAVLTVAAIALSTVASWNLAQQRDRPRLSATWQSTDDPLVLRVTATATGVGVDDQLTVLVLAPARGFTYYFGQTGPDGDGKAQQTADVFIPRDSDVDAIQVSAYVGDVFATCQGEAFSRADLERGELKPTSQRVRAACLVIKAVPAPEPAS